MRYHVPRAPRVWAALVCCVLVLLACGSGSSVTVVITKTTSAAAGTDKVQAAQTSGPKKVIGAQYPAGPHPSEPEHDQAQEPPLPIGPQHPRPQIDKPVELSASSLKQAFVPSTRPSAGQALSAPRKPASDVVVTTDKSLASALPYSNDGEETSEASAGNVVFFSGNWFAAYSTDGGATFTYRDFRTVFPNPTGMRVCCDQVVHYSAQNDRFFWLIQYTKNDSGVNLDRLAIASPADLAASHATGWYYYDFSPDMFNLSGDWFDFPDLALGSDSLYWTTNVWRSGSPSVDGDFKGSMISRLPLAQLTQGVGFGFNFVYRSDGRTFTPAQNTGAHAFWGTQLNTSQIRVFDWAEGAGTYGWHDLDVASWNESDWGTVVRNPITLPVPATGADAFTTDWNTNHKLYIDGGGKIRGAAVAGGEVWFAWTAGRDGQYTEPHIEIARVSTSTMALIGQRVIWNPEHAFAQPSLTSNNAGEVGMAFMWGGGGRYNPNAGVAILTGTDEYINAATSAVGTPWWGHYITVRMQSPDSSKFSAGIFAIDSCATCDGGTKGAPYFVVFGRG